MAKKNVSLNTGKQGWQQQLLWGSFILYAILVLAGVAHHEPWRDEAQSFLAARDNNISSLFKFLPTEGHPPLWYLLIMPFIKMGLPYEFQNWLTGIIVIASIYILIFKSETPFLIKVLIPFNYFFLYEFAVFARNYCLVMFFISAIISLYPKRFDKPILFALAVAGLFNSHMLAFTLAGSITAVYLLDAVLSKRLSPKIIAAFCIMCLSGLYLIPLLVFKDSADLFDRLAMDHMSEMLGSISFGLLINDNQELGLLLFIALAIPFITRTKPMLILIGAVAGILYILGYKIQGSIRHSGVFFTAIFFCYAIADQYRNDNWNFKTKWNDLLKYGTWILVAVIVFQLSYTSDRYIDDINRDYSDAKNAARFLSNYPNAIIAGYPAAYTCSVLPYLGNKQKIYSSETNDFRSYYINDSFYYHHLTDEEYVTRVKTRFPGQLNNVILLCTHPLNPQVSQGLDLLYYTPEATIFQYEMFCIYKFKKVAQ